MSTGSGFSSCSQNSARFSKVVTISGGIVGDPNAASKDRTSWSRCTALSSLQHDTKLAQNKSLAKCGCTIARSMHARSAGLGDCFKSSTER